VTLVIDRTIPADTLHTVLRGLGESTARAHFGVDLDGVELRTDDIDWSLGSGALVVGAALALALALVLSGRWLLAGLLHGQGSERFSALRLVRRRGGRAAHEPPVGVLRRTRTAARRWRAGR